MTEAMNMAIDYCMEHVSVVPGSYKDRWDRKNLSIWINGH